MRVPFIVYADFEAVTKPVHTCQPNPEHSYTKQYQKHIPSSFCYYIKCSDNTIYQEKLLSYTAKSEDDDVAQIFFEKLVKDLRDIWRIKKYKDPADMIFNVITIKLLNFISVVKMDLLKVVKIRTKSEIIVTYQTDLEEQHMRPVTVTTEYRSLYL